MPPPGLHADAAEMKRDKYRNFQELSRIARSEIDYRIREHRRASPAVIIAPHGGKIEPGTAELAEAIAGSNYSFYCFEGLKSAGNSDMHITSTNFDEPRCMALVSAADYVVALHGFGGTGSERLVYLGGLDLTLQHRIGEELKRRGFATANTGRAHLGGLNPKNVCNRGRRGMGVQLEISRDLRDEMMQSAGAPESGFSKFATSVSRAIAAMVGG
jgi:phage replication-related protein YjqB (UPF0714/DUF867 family)